MRTLLSFAFLLVCINYSNSQSKLDFQWLIGQDGTILFDFNYDSLVILEKPKNLGNLYFSGGSNAGICDTLGNLLFYSDGCVVMNREDTIMANGGVINMGIVEEYYCPGSPVLQGAITLPFPENPNQYALFNLDLEEVYYNDTTGTLDPFRLYYHVIDMDMDNGLGAVVKKNNIAVSDTMARGQLQAVRHANGRDWWVMVPKAISNCYHLLMLSPEGVEWKKLECTGIEWDYKHGIGQAVFSPDGTKYARINPWNGLHIFDFDRCMGTLSNPVHITLPADTLFLAAGVSISPNSRFLYAAARTKLYQFDLYADDVSESRILIDTLDIANFPVFGSVFYLSQLAPDGKIYIAGISSHEYYHVINSPDSLGLACDFAQHGIKLPALNYVSIPNFPNYSLGATSSPCDTMVSADINHIEPNQAWVVFPNPASSDIYLSNVNSNLNAEISLNLFDLYGRLVLSEKTRENEKVNIGDLSQGIYFYNLFLDERVLGFGKLIIKK